uniref:Protein tincar n=1 Tax=Lygus hesperus TaxID=30085 RepID=A0A0A9YBD9_LYGHE
MMVAVWIALCSIIVIANADEEKQVKDRIPNLGFFKTRKLSPQLMQLYEEAMNAAGLKVKGTKLQVVREKLVDTASYFKTYYVNQRGMSCFIMYKVARFEGLQLSSYLCVNDHPKEVGMQAIAPHRHYGKRRLNHHKHHHKQGDDDQIPYLQEL